MATKKTTKKTTAVKKTVKKVEAKPVNVYWDGVLVRTYNLEDHGKDYKQLAEQFATKKGYITK